ncbi:Aspartic peptidase [Theobroma cacao]|nr:Aspartic peptidase [Theobroma cacao]
MYVEVLLYEKSTKATLITLREAKRCGLKVEKDFGQMKAVNFPASTIMGNAKDIKVKIGSWEGKINLTVVTIDDFDFVLGLDFMMKAPAIPFPTASYLMFFGERPYVIGINIACNHRLVRSTANRTSKSGRYDNDLGGGGPVLQVRDVHSSVEVLLHRRNGLDGF